FVVCCPAPTRLILRKVAKKSTKFYLWLYDSVNQGSGRLESQVGLRLDINELCARKGSGWRSIQDTRIGPPRERWPIRAGAELSPAAGTPLPAASLPHRCYAHGRSSAPATARIWSKIAIPIPES